LRSFYKNLTETVCTYSNTYLLAKNLCYLNLDYDFEYDEKNKAIFVCKITSTYKEMRRNHFNKIGYKESSINKKIPRAAGADGRYRRSY